MTMYIGGVVEGHAGWADATTLLAKDRGDAVKEEYHAIASKTARTLGGRMRRLIDLVHAKCLENPSQTIRDAYFDVFMDSDDVRCRYRYRNVDFFDGRTHLSLHEQPGHDQGAGRRAIGGKRSPRHDVVISSLGT